jgi:putative phage-type endonuclease
MINVYINEIDKGKNDKVKDDNVKDDKVKDDNVKDDKVKDNLKRLQRRVKLLKSKPQPPQRSPEWFKSRNTRITASEIACCLTLSRELCRTYVGDFNVECFRYKPDQCMSHYDNKTDYIINKCRTFYGENLFKDSIYTLHGKKYEEIATRLYRREYKTDVWEFGLLQHSRLNWLAASPDGITPNGVMLEIKCPYSRKIEEGVPPIHYWAQMQLQLEVADLDECDFLECEIKELSSESDFISQIIGNKQDKGLLLNKVNEPANSETKYIYPPDSLNSCEEYINWSNEVINVYKENKIEIVPIYYFINKWFVVNVKRRKEWFLKAKPYLKETIDQIRKFQSDRQLFDGYRESIYKIKNKVYLDKYHATDCIIHDNNSTFVLNESESEGESEGEGEGEGESEGEVCLID